jgi:hypothetical protein
MQTAAKNTGKTKNIVMRTAAKFATVKVIAVLTRNTTTVGYSVYHAGTVRNFATRIASDAGYGQNMEACKKALLAYCKKQKLQVTAIEEA